MMTSTDHVTPHDVILFWTEAGPDSWYKKDAAFDAEIARRFQQSFFDAVGGKLSAWEASADGALALVIVLDQFPRNMFRNDARAFAGDELARDVADRAIARGDDLRVAPALRQFFYLPFMHSENIADQDRCVALCTKLGNPENLKFAIIHADIIRRFGRFPHRNAVLGRSTTKDEQEFLDSGGFSG
jgi:uncharacterized protein (DUF924 family)